MTSSLPSQLTSFIGRSADLAACAAPGVLLFVALGVSMSYVVIVFTTLLLGPLIPHMHAPAGRAA